MTVIAMDVTMAVPRKKKKCPFFSGQLLRIFPLRETTSNATIAPQLAATVQAVHRIALPFN